MKLILGIIAFILTFGFSTTLVGLLFGFPQETVKSNTYQIRTNHAVKHKIASLLRRDDRNGRIRDAKILRVDGIRNMSQTDMALNKEYRSAIVTYVNRSASISDAGLPHDFQYAWRNHMRAWKKEAAYLNSLERGSANVDAIAMRYSENTREINPTFHQVLRIAERYGVDVPRRYYK